MRSFGTWVNILSSRLEGCPISPAKEVAVGKGHVEACSDGVIAIVITINLLELEAPHDCAAVVGEDTGQASGTSSPAA
jgi:hypothetical protein